MNAEDDTSMQFNLSIWALKRRSLIAFLGLAFLVLGYFSYKRLGQSEDPPFTFKVMVLKSYWSGASAREVEQQLTDKLEKKLQEVPYLEWVRSYSKPGESLIFVAVKDSLEPAKVKDTWYQVRKKIGDSQTTLPAGVQGPFFNDEFGDTYTHIFALSAKGVDLMTLKAQIEHVRSELLHVSGVSKIDLLGEQEEKLYIEFSNARLATLHLSVDQIIHTIQQRLATPHHAVYEQQDERVMVRIKTLDVWATLGDLYFYSPDLKQSVRLKEIATLHRAYQEPPQWTMRFQGEPVIGLGVIMLPGENIMGLEKRMQGALSLVRHHLPLGFRLDTVTSMPEAVDRSIHTFSEAFLEAIAIVFGVCLLALGWRTGLIVMLSIPVVLGASFCLMHSLDIGLHKISLGALILALGLLVDDAIIVVESMLVRMEEGKSRLEAAGYAYQRTAFPMLTGTLLTIVGFLPIATAHSTTGEYTRSLFEVVSLALILSWLVAVTIIPCLGYFLIPQPGRYVLSMTERIRACFYWLWKGSFFASKQDKRLESEGSKNLYDTSFYKKLRLCVALCVHYRYTTIAISLVVLAGGVLGFQWIPQQFFPDSNRPELVVDLKLSDGSSYTATQKAVDRFDAWLSTLSGVQSRVCYVGNGSPRFYLPLDQQLPSPNFAQCVVLTQNNSRRESLRRQIINEFKQHYPELRGRVSRLENGPPVGFPIQFRVSGRDASRVRRLANALAEQVRLNGFTRNVQLDWDEPIKSLSIRLRHEALARTGLTEERVAQFIEATLQGMPIAWLREGVETPLVVVRATERERKAIQKLPFLALPLPGGGSVPLQSIADIEPVLEEAVIWRRNRQLTMTVRADVIDGIQSTDIAKTLDHQFNSLRADLPQGYTIELGGVIEDSTKGQDSIIAGIPLMLFLVVLLLMIQLKAFSRVLVVVLTAPLGIVGVTLALWLSQKPFGFVAMLGTIALSGIIMRNTVILVEQIDQNRQAGQAFVDAIIEATIKRFRPITLTASAAVLSLIPLAQNDFFGPMAVAMMGGVLAATVLTVLLVPAWYALGCKKEMTT